MNCKWENGKIFLNFLLTNKEISVIMNIEGYFYILTRQQIIEKEERMSNEQVKELLDMVMALPKGNYNMQFTYDNEDNDVQIFVYGKKWCECCGKLNDVSDLKSSNDYDVIKKFIEKWREIIEKENENDRGNN